MDAAILIEKLRTIFCDDNKPDDEVASDMLELMDDNQEIIQFDNNLSEAYRELNIWSRKEINTGPFLDAVNDLLELKTMNEWNDQERLEIEQEQELIRKAEIENWKLANHF